MNTSATTSPTT